MPLSLCREARNDRQLQRLIIADLRQIADDAEVPIRALRRWAAWQDGVLNGHRLATIFGHLQALYEVLDESQAGLKAQLQAHLLLFSEGVRLPVPSAGVQQQACWRLLVLVAAEFPHYQQAFLQRLPTPLISLYRPPIAVNPDAFSPPQCDTEAEEEELIFAFDSEDDERQPDAHSAYEIQIHYTVNAPSPVESPPLAQGASKTLADEPRYAQRKFMRAYKALEQARREAILAKGSDELSATFYKALCMMLSTLTGQAQPNSVMNADKVKAMLNFLWARKPLKPEAASSAKWALAFQVVVQQRITLALTSAASLMAMGKTSAIKANEGCDQLVSANLMMVSDAAARLKKSRSALKRWQALLSQAQTRVDQANGLIEYFSLDYPLILRQQIIRFTWCLLDARVKTLTLEQQLRTIEHAVEHRRQTAVANQQRLARLRQGWQQHLSSTILGAAAYGFALREADGIAIDEAGGFKILTRNLSRLTIQSTVAPLDTLAVKHSWHLAIQLSPSLGLTVPEDNHGQMAIAVRMAEVGFLSMLSATELATLDADGLSVEFTANGEGEHVSTWVDRLKVAIRAAIESGRANRLIASVSMSAPTMAYSNGLTSQRVPYLSSCLTYPFTPRLAM